MNSKKQLITSFVLIIGVIVLINVLSNSFHLRLDFTADKSYTLSKATKDILKELKEPVTVTAYFSKNLPPDFLKTRTDFKDMLVEYNSASKNKLAFEFKDPSEGEELEQKAQQSGIQPVIVNVREKDQMKQQKAYLGAVIQLGEKTEIIPVIQPGAAMEYALSSAIKKISVAEKPTIGLIQGHGEPSPGAIYQVYSELNVLYNVEPAYITDTAYTLSKYKTIAIVAPKDTFPKSHLEQLEKFINDGGNVFVAIDHVEGNFQNASGFVKNIGLEEWIKKQGLTIDDNFVIDQNCGSVMVQVQQGAYMQMQFPYLPIIKKFADHPITKGLDAVIMQFASTVSFSGDASKTTFIPLAFSSEKSGTQPVPVYFDINRRWGESDFTASNQPVAAALVPKTGSKAGKLIVVTDGAFAVNGESQQQQQQQQQQLQPDNVNLMVNSIDWLSDESGLIDLRTKSVTARFLDQMDDGKKTFLKYLNFALPILLIVAYGFYRSNRKRSIRVKRMEARYV